jgi:ubiquitin C-terminal hydrolase
VKQILEFEKLDGINNYFECNNCNEKTPATVFNNIYDSLPPVLHINLNRFKFGKNGLKIKNSKILHFPLTFKEELFISTT